MYRKIKIGFISLIVGLMCSTCAVNGHERYSVDTNKVEVEFIANEHDNRHYKTETIKIEPLLTQEEIDLIAQLTMAEAGGESELGQRLVIDVILNRFENCRFPDTIHGVIYAKNQFAPMRNGAFERCYVKEDIRRLVVEEMVNRTNSEVLYFRTKYYHKFGTPLFQEGAHYFSTI